MPADGEPYKISEKFKLRILLKVIFLIILQTIRLAYRCKEHDERIPKYIYFLFFLCLTDKKLLITFPSPHVSKLRHANQAPTHND